MSFEVSPQFFHDLELIRMSLDALRGGEREPARLAAAARQLALVREDLARLRVERAAQNRDEL